MTSRYTAAAQKLADIRAKAAPGLPGSHAAGTDAVLARAAAKPGGFDAQSAVNAARRRSRRAKIIAALLACLIVLAAAAFFFYERSVIEGTNEANAALYAKVLEDQTSRVVSSVDVVTLSLSEAIAGDGDVQASEALDKLLVNAASGQGALRSVALVTAEGRVVASSFEGDRDGIVRLRLFGNLSAEASRLRMGSLLAGRSLTALSTVAEAPKAPVVLPMVRAVRHPGGQPYFLVALVNLDYVANQFGRLVDDPKAQVLLSSYAGELLVTGNNVSLVPGISLAATPIFQEMLPKREHQTYRGVGATGTDVIGAYRATRQFPLVVLVEQSRESVVQQLKRGVVRIGGVTLLLLILLVSSTWLIHNSSLRDEKLTLKLKTAYAQALELESRKNSILEASLDAVISTDGRGLIMDFNPAAEQMFGKGLLSRRGKALDELILAPEVRKNMRQNMAQFLGVSNSTMLNRRMQVEALRQDGSRFPIEFAIARVPMPDETFYTITIRDISERHAAERKLRDSEQRWKLALDAAGDAVWDWDVRSGRMLYSPNWLAMLGYEEGGVSTRHQDWIEMIHPDERKLVATGLMAHLEGHTGNFSAECRMRCQDGTWKWIHTRGMVVERSKSTNKPLRLVGTNTDITERKATEGERAQLLIKSRELARELQRARETEISVGSRIQRSLLLTPQNRRIADLWVSSFNQASQGVDGDFVEVICPSPHAVDIVVGDVMGKGVNAALMGAAVKMQLSRSMIELMTDSSRRGALPPPAEVVRSVHDAITPHLQALDNFVTLCYVRIDTLSNTVSWVGCGHEEPMLIRDGKKPRQLHNQHPPLGVLDKMEFSQGTERMTALDSLFMHSDGVTDAVLANGERLGHDRLQDELCANLEQYRTPAAVMHQMRKGLFDHGVRFTDDLTMVLAIRSDRDNTHRIEMEPSLDSIEPLRHMVMDSAMKIGFDEGTASLYTVAVVEAFTNIVRHAQGRLAGSPIEVLVTCETGSSIELEMIYLADSYTPDYDRPDPDLDDYPEGGFGMGIIRDVCDGGYIYSHEGGVNTILLRKLVNGAPRDTTELDLEMA